MTITAAAAAAAAATAAAAAAAAAVAAAAAAAAAASVVYFGFLSKAFSDGFYFAFSCSSNLSTSYSDVTVDGSRGESKNPALFLNESVFSRVWVPSADSWTL